jgi:hypothetical protein
MLYRPRLYLRQRKSYLSHRHKVGQQLEMA